MRSEEFDKTLHAQALSDVADAQANRASAGLIKVFEQDGVLCQALVSAIQISNPGATATPLVYTHHGWKELTASLAGGGNEQAGPPVDLAKRWELIEEMPKGMWRIALGATEATIGSLQLTRETVRAAKKGGDGLIHAFGDMAVPTIALPPSVILQQCSDTPGNYGLRSATSSASDQTQRRVTLTPRALTERTPESSRPSLISHLLRLAILGRSGAVPFEVRVYNGPVPDVLTDSISTLYEYSDDGPSSIYSTTGDSTRQYGWEGPQFNSDCYSPPGSSPTLCDTVKQVHAAALTTDETIDYLKQTLQQYT